MRTVAELPVAVFDSGVGGLTVLHELLVSLPAEDYVYLGDTARFPYGERSPARAAARSRSRSPSSCSPPARSCWSSRATRPARPALERARASTCARRGLGVDVIGVMRPGRAAGGRAQPQRPDRPAGDAGDGRQRRLRAGGRARPTRTSTSRASPAPTSRRSSRAASRSTSSVVETVRGYCAPLRDAERRHGDPRLHPLPADRADAAAHARPRRHARHLRAPAWRAASSARWPRAGCSTRGAARAATGSCAPATSTAFRAARHALSADAARRGRARRARRAERRHDPSTRRSAATAARPTSCGRSRSSPGSSAPRPARR